MIRGLRSAACAVAFSMLATAGTRSRAATGVNALFIGNSLTAANDLPAMVGRLAAAAHRPFRYRAVVFGGYSLEDHWNQGDAKRAIADGGWTTVVLQQGPSSLPDSRRYLIDYTKRFAAEAARVGADTALYMVWPAQERFGDFEGVRVSYQEAAKAVHGRFIPAGEAWRAAWRRDSRVELYGPDGFHPTPLGSYLAALVMYRALFKAAPPDAPPPGVSAERAAVLQQAARDVFAAR